VKKEQKKRKQRKLKPTLTLTCGLARCGKSTWVRKNKGNAIVVCPDDIRSKILGHQFHKHAEEFVWAIAKSMTRLLLDQGKSVIIDATNITYGSRYDWIKLAKEYDVKTKIVWLKTSIKVCKNRNAKSKEEQKLPDGVIDKMAEIFRDPESNKRDNVTVIEIPKRKNKKKHFLNYYIDELFYEEE